MKDSLTQEELKSLLIYNPETGDFIRRTTVGGQEAGEVAGTLHPNGAIYIRITGHGKYLGNRLAWLYMTGKLPIVDVDHEDNDRSNNRWTNLRIATRSQNKANSLQAVGISDVRGVWPHGKRWRTSIKVNQKRKHLGVFDTKEEAYKAYLEARKEYFGGFNPKELISVNEKLELDL